MEQMEQMELKVWLLQKGACRRLLNHIRMEDISTIEDAVEHLPKGEWLLWIGHHLNLDRKIMLLAAAMCAKTISHHLSERDNATLDISIRYSKGDANENDFLVAKNNLSEYLTIPQYAVFHALSDDVRFVPIYTSNCSVFEKTQNQLQTADICREIIGEEIIKSFHNLN